MFYELFCENYAYETICSRFKCDGNVSVTLPLSGGICVAPLESGQIVSAWIKGEH